MLLYLKNRCNNSLQIHSFSILLVNFTIMKTKKNNSDNLATPGKPMSQKKFASMIKEAEEGEFLSIEEFKTRFEAWRLQRKK